MTVKAVPNQIKVEFRSIVYQYGVSFAVLMFAAVALAGYAVYAWLKADYGATIVFGLVSFGLVMGASIIIWGAIAKIQVDQHHSPEKVRFWTDLELLESGFLTMSEFIQRHVVQVMRINKSISDYVEGQRIPSQQASPTQQMPQQPK